MSAKICGVRRAEGIFSSIFPIAVMLFFEKLWKKDTETEI
jgi:hypothetical protein